jgi:Type II CAAX prenyl endopeptidase Rce1-like/PDZ domain
MAIGMLILFWQTIFQREYPSQGPFGDARGAPLSSLLVYACLGATIGPVCEEVFMRGFVYNALRQRLGIVVAMILQAALFALLHPFAIAQRIVVFGVGVALGSIYEWRKTLLTPILVHCFFNTFVMAFGLLAVWRTPYLGVTAVPQHEGCRITSVFAGSPAAKAGIEVDDVLVNCDGRPVHSFEDIAKYVTEHRAGDVIDLQVLRDHQSRVMHTILERRPLQ